ncbi:DUF2065 domain-containing protein, partial [Pseudomonadales bacterium]|nr:DUF2065 domain-containing protein [Pseudomonadales bacterium]
MLQELIVAACLVLVLEGMLPFLSPRLWRQTMQSLLALQERQIRMAGFVSMLIGVG